MRVGSLGAIVFSVSSSKIETFSNLKRTSSANFSEHKRHNSKTFLEYTGRNPDEISFTMILSQSLGVDVEKQLQMLMNYERKGTTLKLIIGKKVYGSYRWVITKHTISYKYFDKRGRVATVEVSINLKEYCR